MALTTSFVRRISFNTLFVECSFAMFIARWAFICPDWSSFEWYLVRLMLLVIRAQFMSTGALIILYYAKWYRTHSLPSNYLGNYVSPILVHDLSAVGKPTISQNMSERLSTQRGSCQHKHHKYPKAIGPMKTSQFTAKLILSSIRLRLIQPNYARQTK